VRVIDVSVPLSSRTPVWPGDPGLELIPDEAGGGQPYVRVSSLRMGTHTGTHLDAPSHLFPGGMSVDAIPLDLLVGDVWVSVIPEELPIVSANALESAGVPQGICRLLLRTSNSLLWDLPLHRFHEDYVAISPDAADWVVRRGIQLLGIDYLSIDPFRSTDLPAHRKLLGSGVVVVEGLDLRPVAEGRYLMHCLPIRLVGAEGAPVRVVLTGPLPSS